MLTFKIRTPYKDGGPQKLLEKLENTLRSIDDVFSFGIIDDCVQIEIRNGNGEDCKLDVRLLEMT